MKQEAVKDYFILNHQLRSTQDMSIFERISQKSVYEVIKIVAGIPVFFEEHMQRMRRSAALLKVSLPKSDEEVLEEIRLLLEKNRCENINVKLIRTRIGSEDYFLTYFIEAESLSRKEYARGIHVILYQGERNKPHLKTLGSSFRDRVESARARTGAYEALLVDDQGNITEGSRSNIFFLKDGLLFTPPARTVLLGVTRKHVMNLCKDMKLHVMEELLHRGEIRTVSGAFITGTTVDIAPIRSIDDYTISSMENPQIQNIMRLYSDEVNAYLKQHTPHTKS
ncbi:MAG: aminotransferase class IV [Deltaproteobacteria bacterium]|nr:aminotransferase class IV [Deltaproteobacteria bacterium]